MAASHSHIGHTLLSRAHSPTSADRLFHEKVITKPLLLQPSSTPPSDNRSARRLARLRKKEHFLRHQKPRPLSAKQKRITGVYDISKAEQKYSIFEGLHRLWVGYMQEALGLKSEGGGGTVYVTAQGHGSKIASADFHGALVEVVRSNCVGRVGTKGIVVRDTKFTFVIITEKDDLRTVPKKGCVFRFEVPLPVDGEDKQNGEGEVAAMEEVGENGDERGQRHLVLELHGSQFENRAADRANKKFKWRTMEYL